MTFTKTPKTCSWLSEKRLKKDYKPSSFHKALSSLISLIILHQHSILYDLLFRVNCRKTLLTSRFVISIKRSQHKKSNGDYRQHLIAPSVYHLNRSLLHVIAGCKTYLKEGRYTWRHDSVLNFLASPLACVKNSKIYVDLAGFLSPSVLTGDSLRPYPLLKVENKCLCILELTVGLESNLQVNAPDASTISTLYDKVKFVN